MMGRLNHDQRRLFYSFCLVDNDVAIALACFGGGSMLAALMLPRLLDRIADRAVMIFAAGLLTVLLLILIVVLRAAHDQIWPTLLALWTLMGVGYSAVQTPSGRLLRRSARPSDRPAVFATQFALSHTCWLLTDPTAGWLGNSTGLSTTALVLAAVTFAGVVAARAIWPADDPEVIEHDHLGLAHDDPHLQGATLQRHAHVFVIDEHHRPGFDSIFGYLDYRVEPWGAVARCRRPHDGLILRQ